MRRKIAKGNSGNYSFYSGYFRTESIKLGLWNYRYGLRDNPQPEQELYRNSLPHWLIFLGCNQIDLIKKLKAGEELCFTQIRKQTLDLGGNAVYSHWYRLFRGWLWKGNADVCMAGTAINLKNVSSWGSKRLRVLTVLKELYRKLSHL